MMWWWVFITVLFCSSLEYWFGRDEYVYFGFYGRGVWIIGKESNNVIRFVLGELGFFCR